MKDEFLLAIKKWRKDKGDATLRLDYPINGDSIVLDLGGYLGDYTDAIHSKYGCHVYVYEPIKEFFEECSRRFANNPKIRCFNYGLSDQSGTLSMSMDKDASSLIKVAASADAGTVHVKAFADEVKDRGISRIDLLKLNVEGAEFIILPHIFKLGLVQHISHIQVQFHEFYPDAHRLRNEIRAELSKTHTESWNYPFVWESWSKKNGLTPSGSV